MSTTCGSTSGAGRSFSRVLPLLYRRKTKIFSCSGAQTPTNGGSREGHWSRVESLEETAARELFEETSLTAENFRFVDMLSGQALYYQYPNGDEVYNIIAVYAAEGASVTAEEHDEESLETAYFPLDRLPEKIDPRAVLVLDCFTGKHG
ncbi:hypothetical protein C6I21_00865 [Alkalicoccus urumqiensis]|uniref:Nudix hydrolase domain-containing protein n=1 Tax=Alkalicoccus urumqiensis TaxID=1548213 RepID=A0A2P6MLJ6_ALKUR|nr:hypothetical protein C6I21_00865 [Alkalicoccus urumqiensis]